MRFGPWAAFMSAPLSASTFFYVGRWSACTTVRLPGSIPGRRVGGRFFSELNVLVRAEGLAGVGALGRQEVNGACLVSLMNGN